MARVLHAALAEEQVDLLGVRHVEFVGARGRLAQRRQRRAGALGGRFQGGAPLEVARNGVRERVHVVPPSTVRKV